MPYVFETAWPDGGQTDYDQRWLSPRQLALFVVAGQIDTWRGQPWFDGGVKWGATIDVTINRLELSFPGELPPSDAMIIREGWLDSLREGAMDGILRSRLGRELVLNRMWMKVFDHMRRSKVWNDGSPIDIASLIELAENFYDDEWLGGFDVEGEPIEEA